MKVLIVLGLVLAVTYAVPVEEISKEKDLVAEASKSDVIVKESPDVIVNAPLVDASPKLVNLTGVLGNSSVANVTAQLAALVEQLVKEEFNKIILSLQSVRNSSLFNIFNGFSSDGDQPINQEIVKQTQSQADQVGQEQPIEPKKPIYFLPRRPAYMPPPYPFFYGGQQPMPFYNPQPYIYQNERRYAGAGPQWRAIDPTNDESLSEMEALAGLELMLNEKDGYDVEGRGLMSSISSTTNKATANLRSFINSISSALPNVSIVKKTYLVPGLAISG